MRAIIWRANEQGGHYITAPLKKKEIKIVGINRQNQSFQTDISDYDKVCKLVLEAVIGIGKANSIKKWADICFSVYRFNRADHVVKDENYIYGRKILVSDAGITFSLSWGLEKIIVVSQN